MHCGPQTRRRKDAVQIPKQTIISRTVWQHANADFDKLRNEFDETNWDCMKYRRDITTLGVLHKLNLGTAPPKLTELRPRIGLVSGPPEKRKLRLRGSSTTRNDSC